MNSDHRSQTLVRGLTRGNFLRAISLSVAFIFFCTDILAFPSRASANQEVQNIERQPAISDPFLLAGFVIPPDIGTITEEFRVESLVLKEKKALHTQDPKLRTVILIQDAHSVPDAQRSLEKLIEYLQQKYGVTTVALEGAEGKLDPGLFRNYPDKEKLKKVFGEYLNSGELSGAAVASVLSPYSGDYVGIEAWELYQEGVNAFLGGLRKQVSLSPELLALGASLQRLKENYYSAEALEFDARVLKWRNDSSQFQEFLSFLAKYHVPEANSSVQGTKYRVLGSLFQELAHENVRNPQLEVEVKKLAQFVHEAATSPKLNGLEQRYRTGSISLGEYAFQVAILARHPVSGQTSFAGRVSPELQQMISNHEKLSNIRGPAFAKELEAFLEEVRIRLCATPEAKAVSNLDGEFRLYEKLFKFELSREDWGQLQNRTQRVATRDQRPEGGDLEKGKISEFRNLLASFFEHLDGFADFYNIALRREAVFFKNVAGLRSPVSSPVAVVTGGFHTSGLAAKLKEQGIPYAVISPAIKEVPKDNRYFDQMQGKVSWRKYFRPRNGKIDLYDAFSRATVDRLASPSPKYQVPISSHTVQGTSQSGLELKEWRDEIIRSLAAAGHVAEHSKYTRYIDQSLAFNSEEFQAVKKKWTVKLEEFINKLQLLGKQNQLTEANVAKLFQQPASVTPYAVTWGVPGAWRSTEPGVRSSEKKTSPGSELIAPRTEVTIPLPAQRNLKVEGPLRSESRQGAVIGSQARRELPGKIEQALAGSVDASGSTGAVVPTVSELRNVLKETVVFFPPSGFHKAGGRGRELYDASAVVRDIYGRVNRKAREILNNGSFDVTDVSFKQDDQAYLLGENAVAIHLAIVTQHIALWEYLKDRYIHGASPAAIMGASRGADAAYYASGAIDLEDTVELAIRNIQFIKAVSDLSGSRKIVSVMGIPREALERILGPVKGAIAVSYSKDRFAVSYEEKSHERLLREITAAGGSLKSSILSVASHDPNLKNPATEALFEAQRSFLEGFKTRIRVPSIRLFSALDPGKELRTAGDIIDEEMRDATQELPLAQSLVRLQSITGMHRLVGLGYEKDHFVKLVQADGSLSGVQTAQAADLEHFFSVSELLQPARSEARADKLDINQSTQTVLEEHLKRSALAAFGGKEAQVAAVIAWRRPKNGYRDAGHFLSVLKGSVAGIKNEAWQTLGEQWNYGIPRSAFGRRLLIAVGGIVAAASLGRGLWISANKTSSSIQGQPAREVSAHDRIVQRLETIRIKIKDPADRQAADAFMKVFTSKPVEILMDPTESILVSLLPDEQGGYEKVQVSRAFAFFYSEVLVQALMIHEGTHALNSSVRQTIAETSNKMKVQFQSRDRKDAIRHLRDPEFFKVMSDWIMAYLEDEWQAFDREDQFLRKFIEPSGSSLNFASLVGRELTMPELDQDPALLSGVSNGMATMIAGYQERFDPDPEKRELKTKAFMMARYHKNSAIIFFKPVINLLLSVAEEKGISLKLPSQPDGVEGLDYVKFVQWLESSSRSEARAWIHETVERFAARNEELKARQSEVVALFEAMMSDFEDASRQNKRDIWGYTPEKYLYDFAGESIGSVFITLQLDPEEALARLRLLRRAARIFLAKMMNPGAFLGYIVLKLIRHHPASEAVKWIEVMERYPDAVVKRDVFDELESGDRSWIKDQSVLEQILRRSEFREWKMLAEKGIKSGFKAANWAGWIAAGAMAVLLAFHPAFMGAVILQYLPIAIEGWLIIGLLYKVRNMENPWKAVGGVAAGIMGLALIFHVLLPMWFSGLALMPLGNIGINAVKVGLRAGGIFAGIALYKGIESLLFKRKDKAAELPWPAAFRWALTDGLVLGYFFYVIFFPFLGRAFPVADYFPFLQGLLPAKFQASISTAIMKSAFDITFVTFLVHGPMQMVANLMIGEKQQNTLTKPYLKSQAVRSFLGMYPVTSLIMFAAMVPAQLADPSGGTGVSAVHALLAMISSMARRRVIKQESAQPAADKVQPLAKPSWTKARRDIEVMSFDQVSNAAMRQSVIKMARQIDEEKRPDESQELHEAFVSNLETMSREEQGRYFVIFEGDRAVGAFDVSFIGDNAVLLGNLDVLRQGQGFGGILLGKGFRALRGRGFQFARILVDENPSAQGFAKSVVRDQSRAVFDIRRYSGNKISSYKINLDLYDFNVGERLVKKAHQLINEYRAAEGESIARKAAELDPENTHAISALIMSVGRQGRYKEQIALCREAVARFSGEPVFYHLLAQALLKAGQLNEAAQVCQTAINKFIDDPGASNMLVQVLFQQGQAREALRLSEENNNRYPKNAAVRTTYVSSLIRNGIFKRAIEKSHEAIQDFPDDPVVYTTLIKSYRAGGRREESLRAGFDAVNKFPQNSAVYIALANALLLDKKPGDVVALLSLSARPFLANNAAAHLLLAEAYRDLMKYKEADELLTGAVAKFPGHSKLRNLQREVWVGLAAGDGSGPQARSEAREEVQSPGISQREAQQKLWQYMKDLNKVHGSLAEIFREARKVVADKGVEAFRRESLPRITTEYEKGVEIVDAIYGIPFDFRIQEPELRASVETFLGNILNKAGLKRGIMRFVSQKKNALFVVWGIDGTSMRSFYIDKDVRIRSLALVQAPEKGVDVVGGHKAWVEVDALLGESDQEKNIRTKLEIAFSKLTADPEWKELVKKIHERGYFEFANLMSRIRHNSSIDVMKRSFVQSSLRTLSREGDQPALMRMLENNYEGQQAIQKRNSTWIKLLEKGAQLQRMDVAPLILEMVRHYEPAAKEKGLGISFESDPGKHVADLVDPNLLRLVLDNVIGNAVKYSDRGKIGVTVQHGKILSDYAFNKWLEGIVIRVSDEGIGIPQKEISWIFGDGYRASNVLDRPGTGLGLNIVSNAVIAMSGEIQVTSEPGKGTTFTLFLPEANSRISKKEAKPSEATSDDVVQFYSHSQSSSVIVRVLRNLFKIKSLTLTYVRADEKGQERREETSVEDLMREEDEGGDFSSGETIRIHARSKIIPENILKKIADHVAGIFSDYRDLEIGTGNEGAFDFVEGRLEPRRVAFENQPEIASLIAAFRSEVRTPIPASVEQTDLFDLTADVLAMGLGQAFHRLALAVNSFRFAQERLPLGFFWNKLWKKAVEERPQYFHELVAETAKRVGMLLPQGWEMHDGEQLVRKILNDGYFEKLNTAVQERLKAMPTEDVPDFGNIVPWDVLINPQTEEVLIVRFNNGRVMIADWIDSSSSARYDLSNVEELKTWRRVRKSIERLAKSDSTKKTVDDPVQNRAKGRTGEWIVIRPVRPLKKIVVVETGKFFFEKFTKRYLAKKMLKTGVEVIFFDSGTEARKYLLGHPADVDLIITNLNMGRMRGEDLIRNFRKEELRKKLRPVPIIIFSNEKLKETALPENSVHMHKDGMQLLETLAGIGVVSSKKVREMNSSKRRSLMSPDSLKAVPLWAKSVTSAAAFGKYIDQLLVGIRRSAGEGREVLLASILEGPEKYEKYGDSFYRPLYEFFFERLRLDFDGAEGFIGACRAILAARGFPGLREAFDIQGSSLFHYLKENLRESPNTKNASIEVYGELLFLLSGNIEDYLGLFYDVIIRTRPEVSFARAGQPSNHVRAESIQQLSPRDLVFGNAAGIKFYKALHSMLTDKTNIQYSFDPVKNSGNERSRKILEAVKYWKAEPWGEGAAARDGRVENFLKTTVVIVQESAMPLIVADPEHNVVRVVHGERLPQALSIASSFIDGLDIARPEDMKRLAFLLDFFQTWMDDYEQVRAAGKITGKTPDEISREAESVRRDFNAGFLGMRGNYFIGKDEFAKEMNVMMKKQILTRYANYLPQLIRDEAKMEESMAKVKYVRGKTIPGTMHDFEVMQVLRKTREIAEEDVARFREAALKSGTDESASIMEPLAKMKGIPAEELAAAVKEVARKEDNISKSNAFVGVYQQCKSILWRLEAIGMHSRTRPVLAKLIYALTGIQRYDESGGLSWIEHLDFILLLLRAGLWAQAKNELEILLTRRSTPVDHIEDILSAGGLGLRKGYPSVIPPEYLSELKKIHDQNMEVTAGLSFSKVLDRVMDAEYAAAVPEQKVSIKEYVIHMRGALELFRSVPFGSLKQEDLEDLYKGIPQKVVHHKILNRDSQGPETSKIQFRSEMRGNGLTEEGHKPDKEYFGKAIRAYGGIRALAKALKAQGQDYLSGLTIPTIETYLAAWSSPDKKGVPSQQAIDELRAFLRDQALFSRIKPAKKYVKLNEIPEEIKKKIIRWYFGEQVRVGDELAVQIVPGGKRRFYDGKATAIFNFSELIPEAGPGAMEIWDTSWRFVRNPAAVGSKKTVFSQLEIYRVSGEGKPGRLIKRYGHSDLQAKAMSKDRENNISPIVNLDEDDIYRVYTGQSTEFVKPGCYVKASLQKDQETSGMVTLSVYGTRMRFRIPSEFMPQDLADVIPVIRVEVEKDPAQEMGTRKKKLAVYLLPRDVSLLKDGSPDFEKAKQDGNFVRRYSGKKMIRTSVPRLKFGQIIDEVLQTQVPEITRLTGIDGSEFRGGLRRSLFPVARESAAGLSDALSLAARVVIVAQSLRQEIAEIIADYLRKNGSVALEEADVASATAGSHSQVRPSLENTPSAKLGDPSSTPLWNKGEARSEMRMDESVPEGYAAELSKFLHGYKGHALTLKDLLKDAVAEGSQAWQGWLKGKEGDNRLLALLSSSEVSGAIEAFSPWAIRAITTLRAMGILSNRGPDPLHATVADDVFGDLYFYDHGLKGTNLLSFRADGALGQAVNLIVNSEDPANAVARIYTVYPTGCVWSGTVTGRYGSRKVRAAGDIHPEVIGFASQFFKSLPELRGIEQKGMGGDPKNPYWELSWQVYYEFVTSHGNKKISFGGAYGVDPLFRGVSREDGGFWEVSPDDDYPYRIYLRPLPPAGALKWEMPLAGAAKQLYWSNLFPSSEKNHVGQLPDFYDILVTSGILHKDTVGPVLELGGGNKPLSGFFSGRPQVVVLDRGLRTDREEAGHTLFVRADVENLAELPTDSFSAFLGIDKLSEFWPFRTVVLANLLNYVDAAKVLNQLSAKVAPGTLIIVQNDVRQGTESAFSIKGAKSNRQLYDAVIAAGFDIAQLDGDDGPLNFSPFSVTVPHEIKPVKPEELDHFTGELFLAARKPSHSEVRLSSENTPRAKLGDTSITPRVWNKGEARSEMRKEAKEIVALLFQNTQPDLIKAAGLLKDKDEEEKRDILEDVGYWFDDHMGRLINTYDGVWQSKNVDAHGLYRIRHEASEHCTTFDSFLEGLLRDDWISRIRIEALRESVVQQRILIAGLPVTDSENASRESWRAKIEEADRTGIPVYDLDDEIRKRVEFLEEHAEYLKIVNRALSEQKVQPLFDWLSRIEELEGFEKEDLKTRYWVSPETRDLFQAVLFDLDRRKRNADAIKLVDLLVAQVNSGDMLDNRPNNIASPDLYARPSARLVAVTLWGLLDDSEGQPYGKKGVEVLRAKNVKQLLLMRQKQYNGWVRDVPVEKFYQLAEAVIVEEEFDDWFSKLRTSPGEMSAGAGDSMDMEFQLPSYRRPWVSLERFYILRVEAHAKSTEAQIRKLVEAEFKDAVLDEPLKKEVIQGLPKLLWRDVTLFRSEMRENVADTKGGGLSRKEIGLKHNTSEASESRAIRNANLLASEILKRDASVANRGNLQAKKPAVPAEVRPDPGFFDKSQNSASGRSEMRSDVPIPSIVGKILKVHRKPSDWKGWDLLSMEMDEFLRMVRQQEAVTRAIQAARKMLNHVQDIYPAVRLVLQASLIQMMMVSKIITIPNVPESGTLRERLIHKLRKERLRSGFNYFFTFDPGGYREGDLTKLNGVGPEVSLERSRKPFYAEELVELEKLGMSPTMEPVFLADAMLTAGVSSVEVVPGAGQAPSHLVVRFEQPLVHGALQYLAPVFSLSFVILKNSGMPESGNIESRASELKKYEITEGKGEDIGGRRKTSVVRELVHLAFQGRVALRCRYLVNPQRYTVFADVVGLNAQDSEAMKSWYYEYSDPAVDDQLQTYPMWWPAPIRAEAEKQLEEQADADSFFEDRGLTSPGIHFPAVRQRIQNIKKQPGTLQFLDQARTSTQKGGMDQGYWSPRVLLRILTALSEVKIRKVIQPSFEQRIRSGSSRLRLADRLLQRLMPFLSVRKDLIELVLSFMPQDRAAAIREMMRSKPAVVLLPRRQELYTPEFLIPSDKYSSNAGRIEEFLSARHVLEKSLDAETNIREALEGPETAVLTDYFTVEFIILLLSKILSESWKPDIQAVRSIVAGQHSPEEWREAETKIKGVYSQNDRLLKEIRDMFSRQGSAEEVTVSIRRLEGVRRLRLLSAAIMDFKVSRVSRPEELVSALRQLAEQIGSSRRPAADDKQYKDIVFFNRMLGVLQQLEKGDPVNAAVGLLGIAGEFAAEKASPKPDRNSEFRVTTAWIKSFIGIYERIAKGLMDLADDRHSPEMIGQSLRHLETARRVIALLQPVDTTAWEVLRKRWTLLEAQFSPPREPKPLAPTAIEAVSEAPLSEVLQPREAALPPVETSVKAAEKIQTPGGHAAQSVETAEDKIPGASMNLALVGPVSSKRPAIFWTDLMSLTEKRQGEVPAAAGSFLYLPQLKPRKRLLLAAPSEMQATLSSYAGSGAPSSLQLVGPISVQTPLSILWAELAKEAALATSPKTEATVGELSFPRPRLPSASVIPELVKEAVLQPVIVDQKECAVKLGLAEVPSEAGMRSRFEFALDLIKQSPQSHEIMMPLLRLCVGRSGDDKNWLVHDQDLPGFQERLALIVELVEKKYHDIINTAENLGAEEDILKGRDIFESAIVIGLFKGLLHSEALLNRSNIADIKKSVAESLLRTHDFGSKLPECLNNALTYGARSRKKLTEIQSKLELLKGNARLRADLFNLLIKPVQEGHADSMETLALELSDKVSEEEHFRRLISDAEIHALAPEEQPGEAVFEHEVTELLFIWLLEHAKPVPSRSKIPLLLVDLRKNMEANNSDAAKNIYAQIKDALEPGLRTRIEAMLEPIKTEKDPESFEASSLASRLIEGMTDFDTLIRRHVYVGSKKEAKQLLVFLEETNTFRARLEGIQQKGLPAQKQRQEKLALAIQNVLDRYQEAVQARESSFFKDLRKLKDLLDNQIASRSEARALSGGLTPESHLGGEVVSLWDTIRSEIRGKARVTPFKAPDFVTLWIEDEFAPATAQVKFINKVISDAVAEVNTRGVRLLRKKGNFALAFEANMRRSGSHDHPKPVLAILNLGVASLGDTVHQWVKPLGFDARSYAPEYFERRVPAVVQVEDGQVNVRFRAGVPNIAQTAGALARGTIPLRSETRGKAEPVKDEPKTDLNASRGLADDVLSALSALHSEARSEVRGATPSAGGREKNGLVSLFDDPALTALSVAKSSAVADKVKVQEPEKRYSLEALKSELVGLGIPLKSEGAALVSEIRIVIRNAWDWIQDSKESNRKELDAFLSWIVEKRMTLTAHQLGALKGLVRKALEGNSVERLDAVFAEFKAFIMELSQEYSDTPEVRAHLEDVLLQAEKICSLGKKSTQYGAAERRRAIKKLKALSEELKSAEAQWAMNHAIALQTAAVPQNEAPEHSVRSEARAPYVPGVYEGVVEAVVTGKSLQREELKAFVTAARSELRKTIQDLRSAFTDFTPRAFAEMSSGKDPLVQGFQSFERVLRDKSLTREELNRLTDQFYDRSLKDLEEAIRNREIGGMAPVVFYAPEMKNRLIGFIQTVQQGFEAVGDVTAVNYRITIVSKNQKELRDFKNGLPAPMLRGLHFIGDKGPVNIEATLTSSVIHHPVFGSKFGVFFPGNGIEKVVPWQRIVRAEIRKEYGVLMIPSLSLYFSKTATSEINATTLRQALPDLYASARFRVGQGIAIVAGFLQHIAAAAKQISVSA